MNKVVYINNKHKLHTEDWYKNLTRYKVYNVESIHNDTFSEKNYYAIIGDDGCFKFYDSENFIKLAEWRDQQINSILES
jgi:hypothetical protein